MPGPRNLRGLVFVLQFVDEGLGNAGHLVGSEEAGGAGRVAPPPRTREHMAFAAWADGGGAPAALFSGGALIVGGCARTDLLGTENAIPLARQLFRSVHGKILVLPDDVAVFPTHGAGSFCAAPSVPMRRATIGRGRAE